MNTEARNLIIIGAGPAGLMAAAQAERSLTAAGLFDFRDPRTAPSILILEKKSRPGRKLLVSGSGRCNISHTGDVSDFLHHYGTLDGGRRKFLKSILHGFTPEILAEFFDRGGLSFKELNEGKLFPESEKSIDVLKFLLRAAGDAVVSISCGDPVTRIIKQAVPGDSWAGNSSLFTIETASGTVHKAAAVILATGGASWPKTGSNGDGYQFAETLGHTVISPQPALTSIGIENYPFSGLSGISLAVGIRFTGRSGRPRRVNGDLLFTHRGLSGPVILNNSRYFSPDDTIEFSFSNLSTSDLHNLLTSPENTSGGRLLRRELRRLNLPDRFIRLLLRTAAGSEEQKLAELSKKNRQKIIQHLTSWPLKISRLDGWNTAMVTAGGIDLSEVNPKTLESRLVPGLYFAGEILDIDGDEGGYNLQFAFSSGAVSGRAAAGALIEKNSAGYDTDGNSPVQV